jgi:hypothetical protein
VDSTADENGFPAAHRRAFSGHLPSNSKISLFPVRWTMRQNAATLSVKPRKARKCFPDRAVENLWPLPDFPFRYPR